MELGLLRSDEAIGIEVSGEFRNKFTRILPAYRGFVGGSLETISGPAFRFATLLRITSRHRKWQQLRSTIQFL